MSDPATRELPSRPGVTGPGHSRISVCMIAQNEEARIGRALESVQWADEIVVIDGGSEDDTVRVAESLGANVHVHAWPGDFAPQIQRAVDAASGDWVLQLDADEVVTPKLKEQLLLVAADPGAADGYRIRRRNYFLGKWIRHGGWWPDPQLRFVRRSGARVEGAPGHGCVHIEGRIEDLTGALEHDTNPTVSGAITRVERYSTLLAPERAGRKRIRAHHIFAHPFAAFWRKYLVQSGWRDGVHGYLIAVIHAMTKFSVYAKAWELQRTEQGAGTDSGQSTYPRPRRTSSSSSETSTGTAE